MESNFCFLVKKAMQARIILSNIQSKLIPLARDTWHYIYIIAKDVAALTFIFTVVTFVIQTRQSHESEQREIAIQAVSLIRTPEFLKCYKKILDFPNSSSDSALVDDFLFVMNTYDHISLLYISGVSDKCIIKNAISESMNRLLVPVEQIIDTYNLADSKEKLKYPVDFQGNFKLALNDMNKIDCHLSY